MAGGLGGLMGGWEGEWRGELEKLTTPSREGIRNASKFAIAHVHEATTVVQVIDSAQHTHTQHARSTQHTAHSTHTRAREGGVSDAPAALPRRR